LHHRLDPPRLADIPLARSLNLQDKSPKCNPPLPGHHPITRRECVLRPASGARSEDSMITVAMGAFRRDQLHTPRPGRQPSGLDAHIEDDEPVLGHRTSRRY